MRKSFVYSALGMGTLSIIVWYFVSQQTKFSYVEPVVHSNQDDNQTPSEETLPAAVNLDVPYVNEAPENIWTGSWKNGCEEAVIAMVDKYYQDIKTVSVSEAKIYLQNLFDVQKKTYGSDANSDVKRTQEIISNHASFRAQIINNPTVEDIKKELAAGRPVIGFHRGFDLGNKNIPFLPTGSSYHTTVIKGYNQVQGKFITNDPGDSKEGLDHMYTYDVYMKSLHDYNYVTSNTDGPPR
ncbi:MAG TPA: C39 family peptidase, partial [Flavobacterium sp.]|nr:C39 family peptidase [Flavobacterium sp.]